AGGANDSSRRRKHLAGLGAIADTLLPKRCSVLRKTIFRSKDVSIQTVPVIRAADPVARFNCDGSIAAGGILLEDGIPHFFVSIKDMVDYKTAGVDADKKEGSLLRLLDYVNRTFAFNACKPLLPIGYYANVIDLTPAGFPVGIAFSTDGVGTKLLVAEMLGKFDTVGIDCIAMNVNDIICVGATPVSMVDYIAASEANASLLEEVAKGLHAGCEMAGINLCGGELAQV